MLLRPPARKWSGPHSYNSGARMRQHPAVKITPSQFQNAAYNSQYQLPYDCLFHAMNFISKQTCLNTVVPAYNHFSTRSAFPGIGGCNLKK